MLEADHNVCYPSHYVLSTFWEILSGSFNSLVEDKEWVDKAVINMDRATGPYLLNE